MEESAIQLALFEILKDVQTMSGYPCDNLTSRLVPINDLEGFDSLLSVEVTVLIEEKLNCELSTDESIFICSDGERPLCVEEIAKKVKTMIEKKEAKNE